MGAPRLREKKMRTKLFSGHHHNPAAWPNLRVPVPGARTFVEARSGMRTKLSQRILFIGKGWEWSLRSHEGLEELQG